MRKMLSALLALSLLFVAFSLAGCGDKKETVPEDKTASVIKIGGIGPLSGSMAKYGTSVKNGAMLAIDEINAMGGIQFELNFIDNVGDAEKTDEAYDTLKNWGMQVLLGATTTESCLKIVANADNDNIFTITPSASAPEIVEGHDNVFRVCYNDDGQGKASADYIASNALSQGIGVIYKSDDSYSEGVYEAFRREAERLELDIVSVSSFKDGDELDFTSKLEEAMNAGADLLFMPIYYTPAAEIIKEAYAMDYYPIFFGTDGLDGILTLEGFDPYLAEGVHLLSPIPANYTDDKIRGFMEVYQESYGERATQFAADAYDAVYAIYESVKKAEVTADMSAEEMCPKLSEAMTKISLNGITGGSSPLTWNKNGEVNKSPVVVVVQSSSYVVK